ncbi:MAG: hypothetical protein FWD47_06550 [Treponema sp.]|nr:hypothetical protein [Treponema sp.]
MNDKSNLTRDELFDIAFKMAEQMNPKGAVENYSKILELSYPRNNYWNPPVFNNIGSNLIDIEDYNQALEILNEGISYFPNYYFTYYTRSRIHRFLENWEEAINDCNKCLDLSHDYIFALNNRAYCFNRLNAFERTISDYTNAIKISYPENYKELIKTISFDKLDDGVQLVKYLLASGYYLDLAINKKHKMVMVKPSSSKRRVVLYPNKIHMKKSMVRHFKKHTYRLVESETNNDIQYFIDKLIEYFKEKSNGVDENYLPMLRFYLSKINLISGYPRGVSVALYNEDGKLAAIDVGVRNKFTYTSYSGCHYFNNAGTAQLILHAIKLEMDGCRIIDYGTPSYRWRYKHDNLGCVVCEDYPKLFETVKGG